MKIIRLKAENIKKIRAIEIKPEGNLIVIGGRNAQGKTSVLDSITYALGGASSHPDQPIRTGEVKAKIVCELDHLIVTRTFTPKGGSLIVSNKEGMKFASPQAVLDELTGKLTFDPLAFARMQPREQLETLKSLVGLDFAEIDAKRQEFYDERTLVNREVKKLANQLEGMPEYPDTPDLEVSVSELIDELKKRENHNEENNEKRKSLNLANSQTEAQAVEVARLENELNEAKDKLEKLCQSQRELQSEVILLQDADASEIRTKIAGSDFINQKVHSNHKRAELKYLLDEKQAESTNLAEKIQGIDNAKTEALSNATFPIKGLSFSEASVVYNGISFHDCSSSEQLKVSLAMSLAMNPKIKVVLIRDGSLLDEDNLAIIKEMAENADAQVWLECVGEDNVSVIIEDGMIKGENDEIPF